MLGEAGFDAHLSHPLRTRAIAAARVKTDQHPRPDRRPRPQGRDGPRMGPFTVDTVMSTLASSARVTRAISQHQRIAEEPEARRRVVVGERQRETDALVQPEHDRRNLDFTRTPRQSGGTRLWDGRRQRRALPDAEPQRDRGRTARVTRPWCSDPTHDNLGYVNLARPGTHVTASRWRVA